MSQLKLESFPQALKRSNLLAHIHCEIAKSVFALSIDKTQIVRYVSNGTHILSLPTTTSGDFSGVIVSSVRCEKLQNSLQSTNIQNSGIYNYRTFSTQNARNSPYPFSNSQLLFISTSSVDGTSRKSITFENLN